MRILITDLNIKMDGHKFGFIQNLINYVSNLQNENEYFFFVNNNSDLNFEVPKVGYVKLISTSDTENEAISSQKSFLKKSAKQWEIILEKCSEYIIDHLVLMELDPYQVEIGKTKTSFTIGGIWFRPYHRMQPEINTIKGKIKHQIYYLQKKLTMAFALRNKNLRNVFVLNDETRPNLQSSRFKYLADPFFEYSLKSDFNLRTHYNITDKQLIFLQFGYIDERKNTENIIKAISKMENEVKEQICLLVIGKFEPGFERKLSDFFNNNGGFQFIVLDKFIADDEMEATFAQSDLILRMNLNFFGSSGVVGIAANHNKACLVSDYGVMAEQVTKYKLGELANPSNVVAIKNKLEHFIQYPESLRVDGEAYRKSHSLEAFAETLLGI